MRKVHNPPSSMELLLDAMCNVFGAVLFMAILIGGVSVSQTLTDKQNSVDNALIEKSHERLKTLEIQIKAIDMEAAAFAPQTTVDPRQIAANNQVRSLQQHLKNNVHKSNLMAENIEELQKKFYFLQRLQKILAGYPADASQALQMLNKEISRLRRDSDNIKPVAYTFQSLQKTAELEPWRLLVTADEIFVLGSNEHIRSGALKNNSVTVSVFTAGNFEYYTIKKHSGQGIKLEDFTMQKTALEDNAQKKYFIELLVEPDAVCVAGELVWSLRENAFAYNWRIVPPSGATLRTSSRSEYEVAR